MISRISKVSNSQHINRLLLLLSHDPPKHAVTLLGEATLSTESLPSSVSLLTRMVRWRLELTLRKVTRPTRLAMVGKTRAPHSVREMDRWSLWKRDSASGTCGGGRLTPGDRRGKWPRRNEKPKGQVTHRLPTLGHLASWLFYLDPHSCSFTCSSGICNIDRKGLYSMHATQQQPTDDLWAF